MSDFTQIISEGLTYDFVKWALGSVAASAGVTFIAGKVLKKLESKKETIYFFSGVSVIIFILVFLVAPRSEGPQFGGSIQQITSAGMNNGHDEISVITVQILNSGSMKSITKNWRVSAKINNIEYQGQFLVPPPKKMTFSLSEEDLRESNPLSPTSITYHGEDSLLEKAIRPVPPGALLEGLLFVIFRGVDASIFKAGANLTISYEDVFSRKYILSFTMGAKKSPFVPTVGLHSDLACPAPKHFMTNATPVPPLPKL